MTGVVILFFGIFEFVETEGDDFDFLAAGRGFSWHFFGLDDFGEGVEFDFGDVRVV